MRPGGIGGSGGGCPTVTPREKGKVLMLLWFPSLGRGLWKLAKRIQKRT